MVLMDGDGHHMNNNDKATYGTETRLNTPYEVPQNQTGIF